MKKQINNYFRLNIDRENVNTIVKEIVENSDFNLKVAIIDFYENDVDISEQEVSFRIERPDGLAFEQITDIKKNGNKIDIKLRGEGLEIKGKCECQFNFKDRDGQMTTAPFYLEVRKNILTDERVTKSDCYESLDKIKTEFETLTLQINSDENIRKSNEATRITNENARISSENTRTNQENTRKSNETSRINAENTRKTQEEARERGEKGRQDVFSRSEQTRSSTFNTSQTNQQNTFNSNEQARQTTFEANERVRQQDEETRKTSETERVTAENTRVSQENTRKTNETNRGTTFNELKTDADRLIDLMQRTVDADVGAEVVEARGTKAKLNDRLNENDKRITKLEDSEPIWLENEGEGQCTLENSFKAKTKNLIVKGKTIGGWNEETSSFDSIASTGESEGNKINILSVGKNLLNLNTRFTGGDRAYFNIILDKNKDYVISSKIALTYKIAICSATEIVNNHPKELRVLGTGMTVKFNSNDFIGNYILLFHQTNMALEFPTYFLQLEQNTVASKYEEYIDNKIEQIIPFEGGLKGLATVQDKIDFEKGKADENIGVYTFTGDENISLFTIVDSTNTQIGFSIGKDLGYKTADGAISNRFRVLRSIYVEAEGIGIALHSNRKTYIRVLKSSLETPDVAGMKKWLKANPTTIYFEKLNSIVHNIEKMALDTYNKTTHIIQENEIAGKISTQYAGDRDSVINQISENVSSNTSSILSNATSIEELILGLAECIKRDGSVEMTDALKIIGDWKGVYLKNGSNATASLVLHPGNDGILETQVNNANGTNVAVTRHHIDAFNPGTNHDISLGSKDHFVWRDVWVGGNTRDANGFTKLVNGLILQWGVHWAQMGQIENPTYCIAFPNEAFHVFCQGSYNDSAQYFLQATTHGGMQNTTSFQLSTQGGHGTNKISWFAIGY